jgi:heme exporter protein C
MRLDGPAIHPTLLTPLIVMALAFTCLFMWLHFKGMRAEILRRRAETMIITRVGHMATLKAAE